MRRVISITAFAFLFMGLYLPSRCFSEEGSAPAQAVITQAVEEASPAEAATEPEEKPGFIDRLFFKVDNRALDAVHRQVTLLSEKIKTRFALYLSCSGKYLELMEGIIAEKGLPQELALLPLIESGFSTEAKSRMKAVGPWQFIASTGRFYGLKINWWVDERKDPVKSTEAAAAYLSNLYDMFGSWNLALAAYNAGEGKVMRALRKTKGDDFWDLHLTRYIKTETKNYVPRFIAAKLIADNPEEFGFGDVEYQDSFSFDEVTVQNPVTIEDVAKAAGTTEEEIKVLNPELIRWCTPPDREEYTLRIPAGTKEAFIANSPAPSDKCKVATYKVKRGDTIKAVSKKTGVPMKAIIAFNSLTKKARLKPGQILYLPPKEG